MTSIDTTLSNNAVIGFRKLSSIDLYFVRHAQSEDNAARVWAGIKNSDLTALGWKQAQNLSDTLKDVPFTAAYSSDLIRAVKTAEEVITKHPGVSLILDTHLKEGTKGSYEGMPMDKHWRKYAKNYESDEDIKARQITFLRKIISEHCLSTWRESGDAETQSPTILVVTHGYWLKMMRQVFAEHEFYGCTVINGLDRSKKMINTSYMKLSLSQYLTDKGEYEWKGNIQGIEDSHVSLSEEQTDVSCVPGSVQQEKSV